MQISWKSGGGTSMSGASREDDRRRLRTVVVRGGDVYPTTATSTQSDQLLSRIRPVMELTK
jgi:hypothetical protein